MKVFISWSGNQSRAIAESFRKWLPGVLQAVKPYFSPDDVAKGSRWTAEIGKELEASRVGILIVSRENLAAPWLMFEAGALAKNLENSKVCPLLFGLEPTDVTGPLVQFQGARFDQIETKRVVKMINLELGESALPTEVLDSVFDMWWPRLETDIKAILAEPVAKIEALRSEREILEEVLGLTRQLSRDPQRRLAFGHQAFDDLGEAYADLVAANEIEDLPARATKAIEALERPIRYLVGRYSTPRGRGALRALEKAGLLSSSRHLPESETPPT
jgi:hypothetical protein